VTSAASLTFCTFAAKLGCGFGVVLLQVRTEWNFLDRHWVVSLRRRPTVTVVELQTFLTSRGRGERAFAVGRRGLARPHLGYGKLLVVVVPGLELRIEERIQAWPLVAGAGFVHADKRGRSCRSYEVWVEHGTFGQGRRALHFGDLASWRNSANAVCRYFFGVINCRDREPYCGRSRGQNNIRGKAVLVLDWNT